MDIEIIKRKVIVEHLMIKKNHLVNKNVNYLIMYIYTN